MPTPQYTALANITLGSDQAVVSFSSINSSYRDLFFVITATSALSPDTYIRFNGSSATEYNRVTMSGNGSTVQSYNDVSQTWIQLANLVYPNTTADTNYIVHVLDYAKNDKHKPILIRGNKASNGAEAVAGRWANTSAITSVTFHCASTNTWAAGSTFALYGVK